MNDLLFDTNVLIHAFRNNKYIASKLEKLRVITIPSVVVGELYQGSYNKRELSTIESYINEYCEVIYANERVSSRALELMKKYTLSHNLLIIDALIAATAYEHSMTLVTEDVSHFGGISEIDMWSLQQFVTE